MSCRPARAGAASAPLRIYLPLWSLTLAPRPRTGRRYAGGLFATSSGSCGVATQSAYELVDGFRAITCVAARTGRVNTTVADECRAPRDGAGKQCRRMSVV